MSGASNYLENKLLDHILKHVAFTSPTSVYISLHTADPTDANVATEVSGNAYARVQLTGGFDAATNGQTQNSSIITFPTPTGAGWATVTHWGVYDAASSGNLLLLGPLDVAKTIAAGDTVRWAVGDFVITCD